MRGFAGTAGNVVINGARPSTKAETLDTTLQRIPAQRVVRVEVGPGDLYGSDYAGKSQVLNIVLSQRRRASTPTSPLGAVRRYTGYVKTDISGSRPDPPRPVDHQPVGRHRPQQASSKKARTR